MTKHRNNEAVPGGIALAIYSRARRCVTQVFHIGVGAGGDAIGLSGMSAHRDDGMRTEG